jgi:hypothetical protein
MHTEDKKSVLAYVDTIIYSGKLDDDNKQNVRTYIEKKVSDYRAHLEAEAHLKAAARERAEAEVRARAESREAGKRERAETVAYRKEIVAEIENRVMHTVDKQLVLSRFDRIMMFGINDAKKTEVREYIDYLVRERAQIEDDARARARTKDRDRARDIAEAAATAAAIAEVKARAAAAAAAKADAEARARAWSVYISKN